MKPKRKLKNWVTVALLSLPIAVNVGILFFLALNFTKLKKEIQIQINCPGQETVIWSVQYE